MSSVASTSSTSATTYTDNTAARTTQKTLGESDFLKLLTTQMSNQDPMNPVSDTDQIAQLAQFSSLQSMNSLLTNSQMEGASNLIGKNVTLYDANAGTVSGTVDSAQLTSGTVYVTVGGTQYAYSEITQVKPASTTTTNTSS
jgi:flagellar basal-body rod modification protein FlgD